MELASVSVLHGSCMQLHCECPLLHKPLIKLGLHVDGMWLHHLNFNFNESTGSYGVIMR